MRPLQLVNDLVPSWRISVGKLYGPHVSTAAIDRERLIVLLSALRSSPESGLMLRGYLRSGSDGQAPHSSANSRRLDQPIRAV
ncbi:hypothetical protein XH80_00785 [Bradyrhizobium sp. CCBAU 45384]|nr:hypothetical protein [Bradyrhizobium sp. CCBAU 45384]